MKNLIVLIVLFATSSCYKSVNSLEPAIKEGERNYLSDKRINTDSKLSSNFHMREPNVAKSAIGNLEVQVELINKKRSKQVIEYQFEWFNSKGMIVKTPTSIWNFKHLLGGEAVYLYGVAPSKDVVDFKLKIKRK